MQDLATKGEEAVAKGNIKYYVTRKICGNRSFGGPIKNSSGNVITKHDEQMEIWKDYFSILLNQDQPALLQRPNIPAASNSLSINCEHTSTDEIRIPPKAIKATEMESPEMLYAFLK